MKILDTLPRTSNSALQLEYFKTFLINLLGWSVLLPTVSFFAVYRKVIDIILKTKHGERYGGLFNLNDGIFFWRDFSPPYLTTVLYIRSKTQIDLLPKVQKVIKEKIFTNPDLYPKLTGAKYSFGGYAYWLKNGRKVDTVVKTLRQPIAGKFDEKYLKQATAEILEVPLTDDNPELWNFYISKKPLENFSSDGSYCYPIVARFHHTIADATSIVALFIRLFGDSSAQNYSEELFERILKPSTIQPYHRTAIESTILFVKKCVRTICFSFDLIFFAFGRIIQNTHLRKTDQNALHGSNYSGKKITVWADENESDCLLMVKKIRERTESRFTCVVGTAISASLTEYFKRNKLSVPNSVTGVLTLLLNFPSIDPNKPVVLDNKTAGLGFDLQLHTSNNLVDTLRTITTTMNTQLKYTDAIISYVLLIYVMGCVPVKLLNNYLGYDSQSFLFTNIPGGSKIEMFDGCVLEKVVPVAPNIQGMGVSFGIISYDNKLQIGVTVDKALTSNSDEVQKIATDFFHNIRHLNAATKSEC
ncbi:hypothetical protein HUJ04_004749 [Dendroctonus ponderosae]